MPIMTCSDSGISGRKLGGSILLAPVAAPATSASRHGASDQRLPAGDAMDHYLDRLVCAGSCPSMSALMAIHPRSVREIAPGLVYTQPLPAPASPGASYCHLRRVHGSRLPHYRQIRWLYPACE